MSSTLVAAPTREPVARPAQRGLVLALHTGDRSVQALETLRRVGAEPALLERLAGIVLIDQGRRPIALRARVALGADVAPLLRVVEQRDLGVAGGIARALHESVAVSGADAVLVLDDGVLLDPAAVLPALAAVRADDAVDVVAWRTPGDVTRCRAAFLPFDAVRAIGLAHPDLAAAVLADLVLRADAAGFRTLPATAGVDAARGPEATEADRALLAMLHEPVAARGRVLRAGLAADLGAARPSVAGVLRRVGLWSGWRTRRAAARAAAPVRSAPEGWSVRFLDGVA